MYKKHIFLKIFLIFILLFIPINNVYGAKSSDPNLKLPFVDVDEESEYYKDIEYMYENGILTGCTLSSGVKKFYPKNKMCRLAVAEALYKISECPKPKTTNTLRFTDISKANSSQKKAIRWCFENNIILGTSETTFSPYKNINKEQLATMLYRYAKEYLKKDIIDKDIPKNITDNNKVSKFAKKTLGWAINEKIILPQNKQIQPKNEVTREEFSKILRCFINKNTKLSWVMKYERKYYSKLSDDEYANFRSVDVTGIKKGIIYRGFSPIDNAQKDDRAIICAKNLGKLKIKAIIDLADDSKETAQKRNQYSNLKKYCPDAKVVYCYINDIGSAVMSGNTISEETMKIFKEGFGNALKYISENEGPYYVHCKYGKDRTGVVMIILESLMGVPVDEIEKDFYKSYENYFHIRGTEGQIVLPGLKRYAHKKLMTIYKKILKVDNAWNKEPEIIKKATEKYLKAEFNLTDKQINNIKLHLAA